MHSYRKNNRQCIPIVKNHSLCISIAKIIYIAFLQKKKIIMHTRDTDNGEIICFQLALLSV